MCAPVYAECLGLSPRCGAAAYAIQLQLCLWRTAEQLRRLGIEARLAMQFGPRRQAAGNFASLVVPPRVPPASRSGDPSGGAHRWKSSARPIGGWREHSGETSISFVCAWRKHKALSKPSKRDDPSPRRGTRAGRAVRFGNGSIAKTRQELGRNGSGDSSLHVLRFRVGTRQLNCSPRQFALFVMRGATTWGSIPRC